MALLWSKQLPSRGFECFQELRPESTLSRETSYFLQRRGYFCSSSTLVTSHFMVPLALREHQQERIHAKAKGGSSNINVYWQGKAKEQHVHLGLHPSSEFWWLQCKATPPTSNCNLLALQPSRKASHNHSMRNTEVLPRESSALYKQDHFNRKQWHCLFLEYSLQHALSRLLLCLLQSQESNSFNKTGMLKIHSVETYMFPIAGWANTANKALLSKAGCMKCSWSLLLSQQGMRNPLSSTADADWVNTDGMTIMQAQAQKGQTHTDVLGGKQRATRITQEEIPKYLNPTQRNARQLKQLQERLTF